MDASAALLPSPRAYPAAFVRILNTRWAQCFLVYRGIVLRTPFSVPPRPLLYPPPPPRKNKPTALKTLGIDNPSVGAPKHKRITKDEFRSCM